jgi:DNA-binding NtrC family response regulator
VRTGIPEKRRSVLLVMRQHAERLLYGDVLDHDGFHTTRAGLHDARQQFRASTPSVVMVGLDDGGAEALDFVRWAKLQSGDCRVIGVTAYPESLRYGHVAGCDACLQVPVSISQVVSMVTRCVAETPGDYQGIGSPE